MQEQESVREPWLVQRCKLSGKQFTMEIRTGEYWNLDYMGSAEFEFGAIPAFQRRFHAELAKKVNVELKHKDKTLYALVNKRIAEDYKGMLMKLMDGAARLKHPSYIPNVLYKNSNLLDSNDGYAKGFCFWIDLDNDAVISTDKQQLTLFRITVQNSVKYMDSLKAKG